MRTGAVIGLDGRNLALAHGTGVATYASMLARCLPLIGLQPKVVMGSPMRGRLLRWLDAALPGARRVQPGPPSPHGWRIQAGPDLFRTAQVHFDIWRRFRSITATTAPDVMHWTYPLPLRFVGRPNIYTVHDLIPLLHPHLTPIDPTRMRRMLACIVRTADHLVTVSEATRQELIDTLGARPEQVTNTWQAVTWKVPPENCRNLWYEALIGCTSGSWNDGRTCAALSRRGSQAGPRIR